MYVRKLRNSSNLFFRSFTYSVEDSWEWQRVPKFAVTSHLIVRHVSSVVLYIHIYTSLYKSIRKRFTCSLTCLKFSLWIPFQKVRSDMVEFFFTETSMMELDLSIKPVSWETCVGMVKPLPLWVVKMEFTCMMFNVGDVESLPINRWFSLCVSQMAVCWRVSNPLT